MIEAVAIAENRYAPTGMKAINMYSMDGGENLTLGQLMAAVCIKAGANFEARSVSKLNKLSQENDTLKTASEHMETLSKGTVSDTDWTNMKNFLTGTLGISSSELPDKADTYAKRMQAAKVLKVKLESLSRQSQEDMIDVQSLINMRDVAYSTSSNLISSLGSSKNNIANNI